MIALARTAGSAIASGIRRVKTLVFGKSYTRNPTEIAPYGYDASPIDGINSLYCDTTVNGVTVTVGYVNTQQKAATGESRIFATDSTGDFKFNVWLKSDGTVLIGDSDTPASYTNFLTKFNELKTGFDLLRTEVNAMATTFNSHTHLYLPPPIPLAAIPTAPPVAPQVPATATIDASKATKIKTN
jgi:hypothetical protein